MSRSYRNSEGAFPIMQGSPVPPEWRIPAHDWDSPPWNRWSFQHLRELVPTVTVPRGDSVWALTGQPADASAVRFVDTTGQQTSWAQMLDDTYTDATMIWHDGRVVTESYFNRMGPATPHIAFSVSKSIVSAVAGTLIEDGMLDPAAPFCDVLPELNDTAWQGATLQQVLDMTTGVRFDEAYGDQNAHVFLLDVAANLKPLYPWMDPAKVPGSIWDLILSLKERNAEHGARFEYRSIETDALGYAMERVSGQKLHALVSERLWAPMGAGQDSSFTVDRAGYAMADGGLNAGLRDMVRFGRLMLEDGRRDGRQIIPTSWIEDIRRGDHGLWNELSDAFLPGGRYRNQFWIVEQGRPAHLSLGIFGQHIFVDPETGTVAAKFSSWPDFLSEDNWVMDWVRGVRAVVAANGG